VSEAVLDASALLAAIQQEPGSSDVMRVIDRAAISAVNLAEVVSKLIDKGIAADEAWTSIEASEIRVVPFDGAMARRVAALRPLTRKAGLSLGDRACLALGMAENAVVLTTDRAWKGLDLGIAVKIIR
jgi:PIN domain nuclease of toxin-antitoxin system